MCRQMLLVKGEARMLLQHLTFFKENYDVALEILKEQYRNCKLKSPCSLNVLPDTKNRCIPAPSPVATINNVIVPTEMSKQQTEFHIRGFEGVLDQLTDKR